MVWTLDMSRFKMYIDSTTVSNFASSDSHRSILGDLFCIEFVLIFYNVGELSHCRKLQNEVYSIKSGDAIT